MIYLCKPNRVARTYLGGHRIDRLRGIEAPDNFKPEEWVASVTTARNPGGAPDEGLSQISSPEPYKDKYLLDILNANPGYLGGFDTLPILLKLLDASERLVIQVHPTVGFAKENFGSPFGKAECWYIISTDPGACVYLGFKEGVTREKWLKCFETQDIPQMLGMLHRIELSPGDVWFVDGGVPHAIGGGCLMAELQEPTDLMVVPEKVTPSGRPLPEQRLHCGLGFEKMFDMFDYTGYSREELERRYHRRRECPSDSMVDIIDSGLTDKFAMSECRVESGMTLGNPGLPEVFVVIGGSGSISDSDGRQEIKAGDCGFIPATAKNIRLEGRMRVLISRP